MGTKKVKKWAVRKIEHPRQDKNLLYLYDEPNEPSKEGTLSYVLQESPFASVSKGLGRPSLVTLCVFLGIVMGD